MSVRNWFITVVLSVLALGATFTPWSQAFEDLSFGLLARLVPEKTVIPQTVVVSADALASGLPGVERVPYSELERLIQAIQKHEPKAVGVQLLLDQAEDVSSAVKLEKSIAVRSGIVLTGYEVAAGARAARAVPDEISITTATDSGVGSQYQRLLSLLMRPVSTGGADYYLPSQPFRDAAGGIGLLTDSGYTLFGERPAQPLVVLHSQRYFPAFSLSLLARALGVPGSAVAVTPQRSVQIGDRRVAVDPMGRFVPWPRLRVDGRSLPAHITAEALLIEQDRTVELRDKVVLLGVVGSGAAEEGAAFSSMSSDLLRSAYLIEAMLANEYIEVPYWSVGLQRTLIIVVGIYLLLLPFAMRGKVAMILAAGIAVVMVFTELLIVLTNSTWVPLALPALFLVVAQAVLSLRHRSLMRYRDLIKQLNSAYRELATAYQTHGQLDQAYHCLQKCSIDRDTKQDIYQLGLEYERRRQFNKANQVYDYLNRYDTGYRDIKARRQRLAPPSENHPGANGATMAATIVIDDAVVERPVIGRYQIERQLGRGAMGKVYLGVDPKIGRTVAIKTVSLTEEFEDAQIEEARRRFYKEAEAAGQLDHPNIVTIYDAGEEHDLAYIAMDYIEGEVLDAFATAETLLPVNEVFEIGAMIADALDYAHGRNVVHRDIKPANVIYSRDTSVLKVTDFGIARITDNSKTSTGVILGSPFYMSPEQITGKNIDGRSDLYSLGVTLYQLFTGRLPFYGESIATLAYQIANDKPKGIRQVRADLPRCVSRIVNKALEKDPALRYQDGSSMAEALRRCGKK